MQLLESSINILDTGVGDYPRLAKVLQTTRVCHIFAVFNLTVPILTHVISALRARLGTRPHDRAIFVALGNPARGREPVIPRGDISRQTGAQRAIAYREGRAARRTAISAIAIELWCQEYG